jgi:hypothetical protein
MVLKQSNAVMGLSLKSLRSANCMSALIEAFSSQTRVQRILCVGGHASLRETFSSQVKRECGNAPSYWMTSSFAAALNNNGVGNEVRYLQDCVVNA